MSKAKLLVAGAAVALIAAVLVALLWWHSSVDDKLGYCKTPTDTCINRENVAIGEPCECLGMGGGVFGLDSTGVVVPKSSN